MSKKYNSKLNHLSTYELKSLLKNYEPTKPKKSSLLDTYRTGYCRSDINNLTESELKDRLRDFYLRTPEIDKYTTDKLNHLNSKSFRENYSFGNNYSEYKTKPGNNLLYNSISKFNFISDEELRRTIWAKQNPTKYQPIELLQPRLSYNNRSQWNVDQFNRYDLEYLAQTNKEKYHLPPLKQNLNETRLVEPLSRAHFEIEQSKLPVNVNITIPDSYRDKPSNFNSKLKASDASELRNLLKQIENNSVNF